MVKKIVAVLLGTAVIFSITACGNDAQTNEVSSDNTQTESANDGSASSDDGKQVADASDMAEVEDVVEDGMVPVTADEINDGVYEITVDSSSSMFNIVSCELTVEDGSMTAVMTMSGTGYRYLYMGTGEEAVDADESEYIPYEENEDGANTFKVPVEALDAGIDCAAFSKKKEMWYDRTLVFRADSLPDGALKNVEKTTVESLGLADGTYSVEVALSGGSGRAGVTTPTELKVEDGEATAVIEWSSPNYDYMLVGDEKYLPVNEDGNSVFEIPVDGFDYEMKVVGDTTAMSKPYEIDYTLYFDSGSIE